MSSSIVRQALEIVDQDDLKSRRTHKKQKRAKDIIGAKRLKDLQGSKKITISDLRKTLIPKEEIYKKNLEKLALLRKITTLKIDEDTRNKIIERSVTKRPIKTNSKKKKKDKETVFTEEDFKKFEEEYTGE